MPELVALVAFLAVTSLVFLLAWQVMKSYQNPVRRRLDAQPAGGRLAGNSELIDSLASQLPQRASAKSELAEELRRAGYFKPSALNIFLSVRNGAVIVAILATGLVAHSIGPDRHDLVMRVLAGGVTAAGLCWGLPRLFIKAQGKRRVERISRSLPFALDMTVMCLGGGLTLREALAHVSREIRGPHSDLAAELAIIQQQSDMTSMESAFRQFGRRISSPEVAAMVALIIQNQQLGTDIARSINQFAEAIRLRWRQMADERASKIGVYMLFPLSLLLMPAVLIVLAGPAAVELFLFLKNIDSYLPPR